MSSSKSALLDLPVHIRLLIFEFSGIVRICPLSLGEDPDMLRRKFELDRRRHPDERKDRYRVGCIGRYLYDSDRSCPDLSVSLLRVCRSVYHEALSLLYGNNKFIISWPSSTGMKALLSLSPPAVASLSSLLVRVKTSQYLMGHECVHKQRAGGSGRCGQCGHSGDASESHLTKITEDPFLEEWRPSCAYIAKSIQPGQLKLAFICDYSDTAVAQAVVKPLLELPRLVESQSDLEGLGILRWQHCCVRLRKK